ncbi:hypothetical protein JCM10207_002692 [Rhodosporidiobolus poonsookiae]
MAKSKPPASPANLDSFLGLKRRPPSPPSPSNPPRKLKRSSDDTSTGGAAGKRGGNADKGKGKADEANLGEMVLDDSDDDAQDDDDDLLIVEPTPSTSTSTAGKKADSDRILKRPPASVASIFQKKAPASPASTASPKAVKGKVKAEDDDTKPDVKPASPLKSIAIFDTSAASTSTAGPSFSASETVIRKPLDTPLFSFDPVRDVSFAIVTLPNGTTTTPVPFSFFTSALVLISQTKSRLLIQLILTNLLRTIIVHSPSSLLAALYLLSNRIAPSYALGTELGVGWQVLSKAIKETSGATAARLKELSNKHGDPGDIAFEASAKVRLLVQPKALTVDGVYGVLQNISKLKGVGVLAQKTSLVKSLLLRARGEEVRYAVRILVANLRIGAVRLSLLSALSRALCLARPGGVEAEGSYWVAEGERGELASEEEKEGEKEKVKAEQATAKGKGKGRPKPKSTPKGKKSPLLLDVEARFKQAEAVVRRVYARHPNMGHLVEGLLGMGKDGDEKPQGVQGLEERVGLSVGIPLEPMLGSITRSLSDIYVKLGSRPFVSEAKLDGQRGQIHVWVTDAGGGVRPPGVEDGAGLVYQGEMEGLQGKKVWVRTFSRHLEDMSEKYPDIVGTMAAMVARSHLEATEDKPPLRNFILDCEVVAIDPVSGAFKTFQELSYRSKKDVELGDIKVRVGIYAFDLMYLNNESLLSSPFRRRRTLLRTLFPALRPPDPRLAKFEQIPSLESTDPDRVREFFEECLRIKAEGIMVKLLDEAEVVIEEGEAEVKGVGEAEGEEEEQEVETDELAASESEGLSDADAGSGSGSEASEGKRRARGKALEDDTAVGGAEGAKKGKGKKRKVLPATYEPDKRADSWCKVKKDYLEDLGDSLDLVPIAAWHGQGRKAGWWSPFLLACYDDSTGNYVAVSKVLSGFTDAFYKEYKAKYSEDPENPLTSKQCWPEVEAGGLRPDIWFKPSEVWEIRGADFTLSPVYPAARSLVGGLTGRGISVRFPRFIKVRDDKGIEHATTAEQLADLYEKQGGPAGGGKAEERGE